MTKQVTGERFLRCADLFIKSISFENFRNLKKSELFPGEGINVIYGDNAQGKTNLIECLWLFTGGRSFRGSKDSELISFGKNKAEAYVIFNSEGRDQTIRLTIQNNKRSAVLNDVQQSYMSQIIGKLCAVIFSPNHLTLIKNGPEERRSFIDAAICQTAPSYASVLSRYRRVLNERNALLKDIPRHRELEDTLEIWNDRMALEGAAIAKQRFSYIEELTASALKFYDGISEGKEALSISYKTTYGGNSTMDIPELKEKIMSSLLARQNDDIYCGFTGSGVHRDDLNIKINGHEARSFGSQGQQRSAVLAMKLAEADILRRKKGESPVILLDDVLSELDSSRQSYLLKKLSGLQVFITCCEPGIDIERVMRVENGEFRWEGMNGVSSSGE